MPTPAAAGPADIPHLPIELFDASNYAFQWWCLPHFLAAAVILATGARVLFWERGSRVARMFATFSLLFALWQLARGFMRLSTDPTLSILLSRTMYALVAIAAPLLLQFCEVMLRNELPRLSFIRFNWIAGVFLAVASVGTAAVVSRTVVMPWGLEPVHGLLGAGVVLWLTVIIAVGLADLYQVYTRCLPGTLEHRRIRLFGIAVISLALTIVDFIAASGVAIYPFGYATVLVFVLMTAWITRHHGLVEVTAQLAAAEIAAMTRGALLILDAEGVTRVVNERAGAVLGRSREELVGRTAQALLGDALSAAGVAVLARREAADAEKEIPYAHPVSGQTLDLMLTVTAVHDPRGREVAFVCVLRDVTAAKRAERERLMGGLQDALTSLPNRAMFLGFLDAAVERAQKDPAYAFAVFFVGLNRMRVINEDLGYATGDRVLREFAARLRRLARPQDAVARIGGDEFGVLVRGHGGDEDLRTTTERLHAALREPLALEDHQLFLSASIGVAGYEGGEGGGAELLRRAGMAMYRAKESGGVHFVDPGELGPQRTRLEAELRQALEHDELRLYYQPVIDLADRRVSGFEALVRWQHPRRGLLLPADFIDFAEEVGLITEIDRFVMRQACLDLAVLRDRQNASRISVSVNLAEETLLDRDVVEHVQEALRDARLGPDALRIEVLERVAQIGRVHETLARLRKLGVGLYIDDFGTGYSALSRLHEMPASTLKIDREFVRAMSLHAGGQKIIGSIIALAASLGLEVIAEGCGVADEVNGVRHLGCRYVQGFYFSAAVPPEEAAEMLGDSALLRQRFELLGLAPAADRLTRRAGGV